MVPTRLKVNPSLIENAVSYRLLMGYWLGVGTSTIMITCETLQLIEDILGYKKLPVDLPLPPASTTMNSNVQQINKNKIKSPKFLYLRMVEIDWNIFRIICEIGLKQLCSKKAEIVSFSESLIFESWIPNPWMSLKFRQVIELHRGLLGSTLWEPKHIFHVRLCMVPTNEMSCKNSVFYIKPDRQLP